MSLSSEVFSPEFIRFVEESEPRLSYAFFAAYGSEVGREVTADVFLYAWEHWERLGGMGNPTGYLYRVGQSKSRWYLRPRVFFPHPGDSALPWIEPGLPAALERLTKNQRIAVVLVHGMGWTEQEVAELTGKSRSTVRTHLDRGLERLRAAMAVTVDA